MKKKITAVAVAGMLALGAAAPVIAEEMLMGLDAIAKRQELMKQNGGALKAAGTATGDAAVTGAQTLVDNFAALGKLWPNDSMEGGKTKALPAIWNEDGSLSEGFLVAYTN